MTRRKWLSHAKSHRIAETTDWTCAYCLESVHCLRCGEHGDNGDPGLGMHIDHVIPLSRGGRNHMANLVAACERCNLVKHNRPAVTVASWLGGMNEVQRRRLLAFQVLDRGCCYSNADDPELMAAVCDAMDILAGTVEV